MKDLQRFLERLHSRGSLEQADLAFTLDAAKAIEKSGRHLRFEPLDTCLLFTTLALQSGAESLSFKRKWGSWVLGASAARVTDRDSLRYLLLAAEQHGSSAQVFSGASSFQLDEGELAERSRRGDADFRMVWKSGLLDPMELARRLQYCPLPVELEKTRLASPRQPCLVRSTLEDSTLSFSAEIQLLPSPRTTELVWVRWGVAYRFELRFELAARVVVFDDSALLDLSRTSLVRDTRFQSIEARCLQALRELASDSAEQLSETLDLGMEQEIVLAAHLQFLLRNGRLLKIVSILEGRPAGQFAKQRLRLAFLREDTATVDVSGSALEQQLLRSRETRSTPDLGRIRSGRPSEERLEEAREFLYWAREELAWGRPVAAEHLLRRASARFSDLLPEDHPWVLESWLARVDWLVYVGQAERATSLVQQFARALKFSDYARRRMPWYRVFTVWQMGGAEQALAELEQVDSSASQFTLRALLHQACEQPARAREMLQESLAQAERALDPLARQIWLLRAELALLESASDPGEVWRNLVEGSPNGYEEALYGFRIGLLVGARGQLEAMLEFVEGIWQRLPELAQIRENPLDLHWDGPPDCGIPFALSRFQRPYPQETSYWARLAARVAGTLRPHGHPRMGDWLERSKRLRLSECQLELINRGQPRGRSIFRWKCQLKAPGRQLQRIFFRTERGTEACYGLTEEPTLLVMKGSEMLGAGSPLPASEDGYELTLLTPTGAKRPDGTLPIEFRFEFDSGPCHRCWPSLV